MKNIFCIIFLFFSIQNSRAQKSTILYGAIDKKALALPDSLTKSSQEIAKFIDVNFKNESEKVRAIYIWVASNIEYDIQNMFAINFYEKKEDKISKPLKTRKGICENYAHLFNDICLNVGIKSRVIEGYTKQNGFADYIPHAWCAALVDSSWYIFDPTWGSGFISNSKFVKKINNEYFMASPYSIIKSHMPFDMLWQFLNYPITNQEFYEGKVIQNKSKEYFNFIDSIKVFNSLGKIEQLSHTAIRIEKNGIKNSLIYDRLAHIKSEIEYYNQNEIVKNYNNAGAFYNEGVNLLNEFINYRNKQFTPQVDDFQLKKMVEEIELKFFDAKEELNKIINSDDNTKSLILSLRKSIYDVAENVNEQKQFVALYLSKNKMGRKSIFTKYTWFGIPLN
jgi:Transglutaminase-like superfamily